MPSCVIKTCKSHSRKHTKAMGITFHEFPQAAERREKWINAILFTRDPDWRPSKYSSICSVHFHESDFYTTNKGLRRLKKTAIPRFKLLIRSSQPQHLETLELDQQSTSTTRYPCYESPTFESLENLEALSNDSSRQQTFGIDLPSTSSQRYPCYEFPAFESIENPEALSNDSSRQQTFGIDLPSTSSQRYPCYEFPAFESIENLEALTNDPSREPLQDISNSMAFAINSNSSSRLNTTLNTTFIQPVNKVLCTEKSTEEVAMDVDLSNELQDLTNDQSMENVSTMSSLPEVSASNFHPYCVHQESQNSLQKRIDSPISSYSDINSYLESPKTHALKTKLKTKTRLADLRLKKLKNLQRINRRLNKQNLSLKEMVKELKEKRYISSDDEQKLSKHNVMVAEIFNRIHCKINKRKRTTLKFPASIRKFALTLDFLSPAGYKYVRRVFDSCLPHPVTLNKWYQNIDGNPGFSEEAFRALKDKVVATTDRQLRFCLSVDEMAIRQKKIFNGKFMEGLVSFGENTEEIATQAYCFMLVPINDSFKLPLGYFLVNGFSGEQRANLINRALEKCQEVGAVVVTLTFDGCASNFAAANELGCKLDDVNNLKTYFPHPSNNSTNVCLILDPCHMVKLVRNTLESKKEFIDLNGKNVHWQYLVELQKFQENLGLHFANKITEQHIKFRNQIMKVKLATQLFSGSVASALDLCENELKLSTFNNASATRKLVQLINDLFDILNSRSIKDFGLKQPICAENKEQQFKLLDEAEEYLKKLKLRVPLKKVKTYKKKKTTITTIQEIPIIETRNKTGFIGLIICIKSLRHLYEELVEKTEVIKYLPSYKYSQDHIELFFGNIRSHGGHNNNPDARQLRGAFRKLLNHFELKSNFTGNCIPLENYPILNCSSAVSTINRTVTGYRFEEEEESENTAFEKDTQEVINCDIFSEMLDATVPPESIEQIVGYISGFVSKKINRKIKCRTCTNSLFASEKLYFHKLIDKKNLGGLIYPSVDVYKVCIDSENVLRKIFRERVKSSDKNYFTRVSTQCFKNCINTYKQIFQCLDKHSLEQPATYNHRLFLVRSIIEEYVSLRLHFNSKKESYIKTKRQVFNKLTLFRGT